MSDEQDFSSDFIQLFPSSNGIMMPAARMKHLCQNNRHPQNGKEEKTP